MDSRKYRAKYQKKLYHKRKENHQCVRCGRKLEEKYKSVLCEKCNERYKMYHRNYYKNYKSKEIIFAKIKIALSKAMGDKREDKETKQITERQGVFYIPDEERIVGGWAKVYRKDVKYPRYMSVSVGEAIQTKKDGTPNTMWSTKLATMIEKVAKVRALRECFVDELSGVYAVEGEEEPLTEVKDVTPEIIPQEEPQTESETLSMDDF